MDSGKIAAQMKKGILEYIILSIISKGEIYASDIIDALKKNDLIVVEGTLYPLLSRLRIEELLNYSRVESLQGPPRKYYTLTEKGQESLTKMRSVWKSMVQIIYNIDPLSK